jgi:outer membrane protein
MTSLVYAAAAAAVLALAAGHAAAAPAADDFTPITAGHWDLDVRISDVAPNGNYDVKQSGAPTGLYAHASDSVMPTVGISYHFTDHFGAELILGTTDHAVKVTGPSTDVKIYDTWVLPPVLTAKYYFTPKSRFSPYVGFGPNAMIFYGGSNKNGFTTHLQDGVGYAAQAGFDVALHGRWHLNADLKKVWFETNAKVDGGTLTSKVNLDPVVGSVGVGYRF